MSMVGAQLRQAREASGFSIHDVAEVTKIRTDHLEALESGDYEVFSAQVYIRGSVRNYARLLKLDVPQVIDSLNQELSGNEKFCEPPPLTNKSRTLVDTLTLLLAKINWKVSLVVGGVIAAIALLIGVYSLWQHYRATDPLNGLSPGIYRSRNGQTGETIPLPKPRKP